MLDWIQERIETLYGIRCELKASDCLVGPKEAARLGGTGRAREELLLREDDEGLAMALYVAPDLLGTLRAYESMPSAVLDNELAGFCEATEGVSHFLYMAQTAQMDRRVSLLELEAQAEVDKFAMCALLKWGQGVAGWTKELSTRLFDRVSYRTSLSADEQMRYVEANRLARAYCQRLLPLFSSLRLEPLLRELRYGYRLGAHAKLRYFAATP
ncbi:MAG: hypothetical protein K1X64_04475, partial [Myxococcaceae bacterium]|nr:hypothetical protein [Myxococcaceae bacterium]